jgi:carbon-monoxide dehydrogenase medium subunit
MQAFAYHRPSSVSEASAAFARAADPRWLAGGMSLLPAMKLRLAMPSDLVDLAGLDDLKGLRVERDRVVLGALTPHAEVARSDAIRAAIPALSALAGGIGDPQVRNRGTIGGSIANNDPAADYPAALLALDATITTNKRDIEAQDFFTGMFETALVPGELVTRISLPIPKQAAYGKFPNPASRYAVVGVFVAVRGGQVRVAVTGAGSCVFRQQDFERALSHRFAADALEGIEVPADGLNEDMHASAGYRAHLVTVMAQRAVGRCIAGS